MVTAVRVAAAVPGSRAAGTAEHPLDVDLPLGPLPVRRVISAVVRAELRAFQARAAERGFLRVLTERSLAEAVDRGAVRTGGPADADGAAAADQAADVDPDQAVATALLAFQDGLYYLLVDDEQVDRLEQTVDVRDDIRLLFLRLVPLAGG